MNAHSQFFSRIDGCVRPFSFGEVFEATPVPVDDADFAGLRLRIAALEAELALVTIDRDAALAAARGEGFEDGRVQAGEAQEAALLAATDALHATVEGVEAAMATIADAAAVEAAGVARIAAELIAGQMIDAAPGAAIDAAIGRILAQVARGQEIQVSVHPELAGEMERLVAVRQAGDRRRLAITVLPDPARPWGDAHIHWDQGGVVLDAAGRRGAVDAALAPLLAAMTPAAGR